VARDRKRTRRSGPTRPPGNRVPPSDGNVGLPENGSLEEAEALASASSTFPQLEPFTGDPVSSVSAAAAAFGEPEHPLRETERPHRDERSRSVGVIGFLRGCWAELQRVQWPDRQQVAQATGVVLGFVVVAAVFLGIADEISQQLVNAIL